MKWWSEYEKTATDPWREDRPLSLVDGYSRVYGPLDRMETQVTESENHPAWNKRRKGAWSGDIGGEFYTERVWLEPSKFQPVTLKYVQQEGPFRVRYYRRGPVMAINPFTGINFPSAGRSSNSTLDAWGAEAVAKCKPTNATADMSTFLGEFLREGVPKLIGARFWQDKTRETLDKKASQEFLNWQYGWAPIAREIGDTAAAIWNAEQTLRQFRRDSGRLVRRSWEFPPTESISTAVVADPASAYLPGISAGPHFDSTKRGQVIRVSRVYRRRWFSGAFTYYVPQDGNALDRMNACSLEARKALGLSLTPDVVWNLAPWSWAIDWFTNAGDVLSNVTDWAMYGLVMRYGYIMEHTHASDTYTLVNGTGLKSSSYLPAPMTYHREVKVRRKANPFGFGLTWNGLSPIQLAIAAALGITRFR